MTKQEFLQLRSKAYGDEPLFVKDKYGEILKVSFYIDEYPEDPRNWDNLGTMIIYWSRYHLGDDHQNKTKEAWLDFFRKIQSEEEQDNFCWLPIFIYEHGGITISTGDFCDKWDSGFAGFIYVSKVNFYSQTCFEGCDWKEKAKQILKGEIEIYRNYLEGDVYGFSIEERKLWEKRCPHCNEIIEQGYSWENVDNVGGFYGDNIEDNGILDYLDYESWEYLPDFQEN